MKLRILTRIARRIIFAFLAFTLVLVGYGLCKIHPFGAPQLLPLTAIDRAIPLVPWTVWIYATIPIALLICWLSVPDRTRGRRLFLSLALSAAMCWVVFLILPTTYPRDLFPTPTAGGDSATLRKLVDLRASDDPSNCFPSMHVALAWCMALSMLDFDRRRSVLRVLPLVWAAAISTSTLTTKQHYLIDVAGGIVVAWAAVRLVRHATRPELPPFYSLGIQPIALSSTDDQRLVDTLAVKVRANRWSLDDLDWSRVPRTELPPDVVSFVNQVIYVEEIAGKNFELLSRAAQTDDLRALYARFADDERRHADGLRRLLAIHGAELEPPGLGAALVFRRFGSLNPHRDADAVLVALAIPVFETFLDAGTIPFLRKHPALANPTFEDLIRRICRDESAHLALNWIVSRNAARTIRDRSRSRGWLLLGNPAVYLGALATPFLALDVYGLAYRLGFDLRDLLPSFGRLWRLHHKERDLAGFPPWLMFRLFVICGVAATWIALGLDRIASQLLRRASVLVSSITMGLAPAAHDKGGKE